MTLFTVAGKKRCGRLESTIETVATLTLQAFAMSFKIDMMISYDQFKVYIDHFLSRPIILFEPILWPFDRLHLSLWICLIV